MTDTTERPVRWSRPYARKPRVEASVTEVIGAMLAKNLEWGSAKETALYAVHHDDWRKLETAAAVDQLRTHFRGVWDGRAAMGTVVHAVNEAWSDGLTIDVEQMVHEMAQGERNARTWVDREDEVVTACMGYLDGLEAFYAKHKPILERFEAVVRTPGILIGTADWVATLADGSRWLLDIKTTAEQDEAKGVYTDSWTLQLAAYRWATEEVFYEADARGKPQECGTSPWVSIDRAGIVHLRGDGRFELYEVEATPEWYETFCDLARACLRLKQIQPAKAVRP